MNSRYILMAEDNANGTKLTLSALAEGHVVPPQRPGGL